MTYEIIKTPRNTIYLKVIQLAQELFGEDKVTDFEIDKDKLPMVRVDEGMNSQNNNKDMIGTVTMAVNFFSKTDFNQRNLLDSSLGRLHNALRRGELPKDDTYNIEVSGIEEPTPRYDKSTGETLLIKTLVIRLTYTKKPVDVEPTEPIVIWAELDPIEEGSLTMTGTGTPNERILVFISGGVVTSHTMRIGEDGTFSYTQGYSLKGGDIIKVLRLADGQELASYTIPEVSDGEDDDDGYTPEEDFNVIMTGSGLQISGYTGKSQYVKIPLKVNGRPVTGLGNNAFQYKALLAVEIPDTVDYYGTYVFRGCSIKEVKIPEGVKELPRYMIQGNALETIDIPNSVEIIRDYVFQLNALNKVKIGESVKSIGSGAFQHNAIKEVIIPDGVETIGNYAFANNHLERVVIPPSVTSIGTGAFDNDVEIIHEDEVATQGIQAMSMQTFSVNDTEDEEVEVDNSDIVIEGYRGTVAEQYAKENGHTFVALDEDE